MGERSRLIISFENFAHNLELLKNLAPDNEVMAMVKADGYGHGACSLVEFANRDFQIKHFGVATLIEAIELREKLSKELFEIYVFSDVQIQSTKHRDIYLNQRIIPVISSMESLTYFLQSQELKFMPLVLKFNTGMNRLGLDFKETQKVIDLILKSGRRRIDHAMTHLACASVDFESHGLNRRQKERFDQLISDLSAAGIEIDQTSLANSGAIEQKIGLEYDFIRPGLMLYGPSSLIPRDRRGVWKGRMVSSLETYVIQSYPVSAGEPVGYGGHPVGADGVLAVVALGYGDGLLNTYRGVEIEVSGHVGKIHGRVNMDMTQILFPMEAKEHVRPGSQVSVWSDDQNSFLKICDKMNVIAYEVFCQIGARVPRVYR